MLRESKKNFIISISIPLTIIIILASLYFLFFPKNKNIVVEKRMNGFFRMIAEKIGTLINITINCEDEKRAKKIFSLILSEVDRIDRLFSEYRKDSIISKLNKSAYKNEIQVCGEVFSLIKTSIELSILSDGAFDITFKPLWDIYKKRKFSEEEIKKIIGFVNYKYIKLNEKQKSVKFEKKGVEIALGGIAKGYVVRRISDILEKNKIKNYIIQAGGDIYAKGRKNGKRWKVGIQNPVQKRGIFIAEVELENKAISTSGGYERFVKQRGEKIHHIIDPKKGKSASDFLSVSVVGKDPVLTDAISTTIFVLGKIKWRSFLKNFPGYEVFIIDNTKEIISTNNNIFKIKDEI